MQKTPPPAPPKSPPDRAARAERLARALRANLGRRKAQQRARDGQPGSSGGRD